jgi:hypothetical protein
MNNKIIPLNWDDEVWKFDDLKKIYVRGISPCAIKNFHHT